MTLKIGRDVQFIKTETDGRDFKESKGLFVQKSQEKGRLQFMELEKRNSENHF